MSDRPNILFLMSDEHRADVAGFAGDSVVRTPVLDELARTGVVFRNAYTPAPICVPARQCMAAGQLPKTCGCEKTFDLAPFYPTFARHFSSYAYRTVCSGKLHHMSVDQMQGWTKRIAPDAEIHDWMLPGQIEEEFAKYRPAPGTGKWMNQKEIERAGVGKGPWQNFDEAAVDGALEFVQRHFIASHYDDPTSHRPLLLKLSLLQPHYPFVTDREKFEYYLNRVPIYTEEPCDHPVLSLSQMNAPVDVTERDIRRATAAYYGMIETVDTDYGRLMQAIESAGQNLDDWIIVYTSDHGEMLGQHGIWEKTRFYEASVKVPLIIRWPKGFAGGRVIDENVNLCDLFATLCELASLPTPDGLDSRSLAPFLRGESTSWNNETVSWFHPNHVMIKQDHLKYQYYGEDVSEVLFDLETDPGETTNVVDAHAEAMARFRTRLAELGHGPDARPDYTDAGYTLGSR